ncbi:unnamed protein product (macronuclear) [Paramecium tetraurelia]|uniref:Uncharacterized protein n=1 Tax=Paramecium tetraurelia TaxID=5888 RepID=A0DF38_PARTE|nr:uncharacterized protein GSPATT00039474001 [Paramecium tetraurelia]CAK81655.1 unnamed protein product [Paramecium tetraurelia]|eukprot:XP_001449052.1 hypothetical protein (macronuclear) [Paramecium tetraurelia strain d4-2]
MIVTHNQIKITQNQINPNQQNEFERKENDICKTRKDEVKLENFRSFQSDILQLEALYNWLSNLDFSYYIASLIFYRSDLQELFLQYVQFFKKDEYYTKLMDMQSQYFQQQLNHQCFSQLIFHNVPRRQYFSEDIFVDYLDKIIVGMKLDYKILLEDFITYFELFNLQKNKIAASLSDLYAFRKNDIAFGNIRFVSQQKDGLLIDFKQPIGKFQDIQFIEHLVLR